MIAPTPSPSMPISRRIRAVYVGLAPSHSSMATSSTASTPARTATCGIKARSMRWPTIMYSSTTGTSWSRGRSPSPVNNSSCSPSQVRAPAAPVGKAAGRRA